MNNEVNAQESKTPDAAPLDQTSSPVPLKRSRIRRVLIRALSLLLIVAVLWGGIPWVIEAMHTVSTDDAYVNGHVTFVAPRISGQVSRVLVDDNNRVHKGDLLVQLDPEPFDVKVRIAQSVVDAAKADLVAKRAETRGIEAYARSLRFGLQRAIEDVNNKVAKLKSKAATLVARQATLTNAQNQYDRVAQLFKTDVAAKQELDDRTEALHVAKAEVDEALEEVHQIRVSLGLPPDPGADADLTAVPDDIDQTFSAVRQAQASLIQAAAQLGVTNAFDKSPRQMLADFYKRDPNGNINNIFAELLDNAPGVQQAKARLTEAQRQLDQAELDRRYCNVVSEIDGVVTRRSVNPGNNVVAGQSLMAVRSLKEIWIDANFKETQLAELRIGQAVDIDVDMYGSRDSFKGRISGFTMGTGSTLALLPAENATGNFVKVVQRLPVRIELLDYDPDKRPLFAGLSVTPVVRLDQAPTGPNSGRVLQPFLKSQAVSPAVTTHPFEDQP